MIVFKLCIAISFIAPVAVGNWLYMAVAGIRSEPPSDLPIDSDHFDQSLLPRFFSNYESVESACQSMDLNPLQEEMCIRYPYVMPYVSAGAAESVQECQYQFQNERWNCSNLQTNETDFLGPTLRAANKETAYVEAITSAGIVDRVTRACSGGLLADCGCDNSPKPVQYQHLPEFTVNRQSSTFARRTRRHLFRRNNQVDNYDYYDDDDDYDDLDEADDDDDLPLPASQLEVTNQHQSIDPLEQSGPIHHYQLPAAPRPVVNKQSTLVQNANGDTSNVRWQWSGCSDNVRYGAEFSRQFLENWEKEKFRLSSFTDVQPQVNIHNHQVGRLAVKSLMKRHCRCHGVSGSCDFKTCWIALPKITEVGLALKEKYDDRRLSVQVARKASPRLHRKRRAERHMPITQNELVYVHKSPSYCEQNEGLGIIGTQGRECNATTLYDANSCNQLCCGRGYNTRVERRAEQCQCKFVYCCHVKCKTCYSNVYVHTCK